MIQIPPERSGRPAPPELTARRNAIAAAFTGQAHGGEQIELGGIRTLCFASANATPGLSGGRGCVLHFHGGGYRLGAPQVIADYAARLATATGLPVYCPAYRLAPDHPFPAALHDAIAVLLGLFEITHGPVIVAGDSAGGGLAASLVSACGRNPRIAGLVLVSPWLDLTLESETFATNAASDALFPRTAAQEAAESYLQGASPHDPLASPLFAEVARFPPTLIAVGTGETLFGDATRLCGRLDAAGVNNRLLAMPGMDHVAVVRGIDLVGAHETFEAVREFVAEAVAVS